MWCGEIGVQINGSLESWIYMTLRLMPPRAIGSFTSSSNMALCVWKVSFSLFFSFNCGIPRTDVVSGSIELHLLCHATLLYCQVDPNRKLKSKSKAKKPHTSSHVATTCSFEPMLFIQLIVVHASFLLCGFSFNSSPTLFHYSLGMWALCGHSSLTEHLHLNGVCEDM